MAGNDNNQAIFGMDCYSPPEIQEKVEKLGVKKATMPFWPTFMLAIVAGGSIGLGGMYYTIVLADPDLSFATQKIVGGLAFCLGLALVMVGGAELFTGNSLIVMARANGQISTAQMIRNWTIVWLGNAVGSLGLVFLVFMAHNDALNHGGVGKAIINLAIAKTNQDWITIFFKGILCNLMVCLAVWLAYAGRSVSDKIVAIILPISAFVAAGFEHCVANMYFLPYALVLKAMGHVPEGVDVSMLTVGGVIQNLIWATLGNIVGGGLLVGGIYWMIYRKSLGGLHPLVTSEAPKARPGRVATSR
ncbi:formate/nitrite transporter family protein [Consotaella salsifontis]|uniref:Formate/nitrite transporter n=1 Tax=Consotaella salsifontis TaxID=1365950 RepID=A0A1T4RNJ1_9HYPH|nr:formate/nitrite transporter family protein [Consotaella salsifontis]SKA17539.1 formate/nitrite transporter [Consotaella salsifontis]